MRFVKYTDRSRRGLEVDLLVDTPKGLLAFEIKARGSSSAVDFRPLRLLASFVVTSGGSLTKGPADGPFWTIPFHRLFG